MKSMIKNITLAALALCIGFGATAAAPQKVSQKSISPAYQVKQQISANSIQPKQVKDFSAQTAKLQAKKNTVKEGYSRANRPAGKKSFEAFTRPAFPGNHATTSRRNSKKAATEYTTLTADQIGGKDYGADYWYYFRFNNGDVFYFDIFYTGEVKSGQTYTWGNMDHDYSWCQVGGSTYEYTDADFTVTVAEDGSAKYVAHAVLSDGSAYELVYEAAPVPTEPLGEVYLNGTISKLLDFTADDGMFQFQCTLEDGSAAYLTGMGSSVVGTFSTTNGTMADGYNFMKKASGAEVSFVEGEFVVTNEGGAYSISAAVLGSDYYVYYFTISEGSHEAATYDVTAVKFSSTYYDSDNDWYCVLQDAEGNGYVFDIVASELVDGKTYTIDDMLLDYTFVNVNGSKAFTDEAEFTISHDAEGVASVVAKAVTSSGDVYNITYVETPLPEPTEVIDIEASNLVMDDSLYDWFGVMIYEASNETYGVDLWVYANASGIGSYSGSDISEISSVRPLGTEDEYLVVAGDIAVYKDNGNLVLEGWVQCDNNVKYNLNLTYVKPTDSTREMTITVNAGELYDFTSDMGVFQIMGYTDDETQFASVTLYANSLSGHHNADDVYESYTYAGDIFEDGSFVRYAFVDGQFDVTQNGDVVTVTGWMLTQSGNDPSDCPMINVTITGTAPEESDELEYDEDSDLDYEFASESASIDDQYAADYQVLFLDAQDDEYYMSLYFFAEEGATTIAPGVYEFASEGDPNTFYAGQGVNSSGQIVGSFIGTVDEEGYIETLWFLCKGTVTVAYDANGNIQATVEATNSYGRSINVTIGGGANAQDWNAVVDDNNAVVKSQYAGAVVIPDFAESVATGAFSMCVEVSSIECRAAVPPTCGKSAFYKLNPAMPVYVPAASVDAYKAAEGWKMFKNIQAIAE